MGKIVNKKTIRVLVCFIVPFFVCMIVSLFPTFKMEISTSGTNFSFHALRIKGLWWSLENGIFPHHINDMANNFMGDADPIGYPYLFLYIPAYLLKFLPYTYCYNIYIIIINIATFILMYISSYYIFKDRKVAIVSSIAFTLFYYRLYDVYNFCRMGEYTGLMFYPLAISGLYNIFFDDKKKWWFVTIAMCGALGSHIITFFYLLLMVIGLCAVFFLMSLIIKREPLRIIGFIKAGVTSILLTLWYTVPFLEYYFEKSLNFSDMGTSALSSTTVEFIMPWDMLSNNIDETVNEMETEVETAVNFFTVPKNMSFGDYISSKLIMIFIVLIVLLLLYKYIKVNNIKTVIDECLDANVLYLIIAIMFFVIYIYYYRASKIEWDFQKNAPEIIKSLYSRQQFSFRELGRGGVFLSLSIGYIFTKAISLVFNVFFPYIHIETFKIIAIYVVLFIMVLSVSKYIMTKLGERNSRDNISNASLSDYQFKETYQEEEMDMDEVMNDEIEEKDAIYELDNDLNENCTYKYYISNYKRGYLSINFDYRYIATDSNAKNENVLLKKNAYTGYNYYIDNVKNDFTRHPNGRPEVTLIGDKGHVSFRFENNIRWTIAFIISIVVFLYCILTRIYYEIKVIIDYIKNEKGNNHGQDN